MKKLNRIIKMDSYDAVSFFNGLVFFAPVSLLVRTQAGVSQSMFFLLQALLSVITFLGEIPTGFLTDRIGYKRSLVLSQGLLLLARFLLFVQFHLQKSSTFFSRGDSRGAFLLFCIWYRQCLCVRGIWNKKLSFQNDTCVQLWHGRFSH